MDGLKRAIDVPLLASLVARTPGKDALLVCSPGEDTAWSSQSRAAMQALVAAAAEHSSQLFYHLNSFHSFFLSFFYESVILNTMRCTVRSVSDIGRT